MEGKQEVNTYEYKRDTKKIIEDFLESIVFDEEMFMQVSIAFFGLHGYDKDGFIIYTPELLTQEEKASFALFFTHVGKRILDAYFNKYNNHFATSIGNNDIVTVEDLPSLTPKKTRLLLDILLHDMSHSFGTFVNSDTPFPKTTKSPFLLTKKGGEINNTEIMVNEFFGFIFSTPYFAQGASYGNRIKAHFEKALSYEVFKHNFFERLKGVILSDNSRLIHEKGQEDFTYFIGKGYDEMKSATTIADEAIEIMKNKYDYILTYLWDNRENPRVLIDLFFQEVGPYIARLRERKAYRTL